MFKRSYHIQMHTPLGRRAGTLEVQIEKNKVRGYMNVLAHREPFEGSIDENGNCSFSGTLVTLMSTIPYTASGQITPELLELSLKGGQNLFPITGSVLQDAEAVTKKRSVDADA